MSRVNNSIQLGFHEATLYEFIGKFGDFIGKFGDFIFRPITLNRSCISILTVPLVSTCCVQSPNIGVCVQDFFTGFYNVIQKMLYLCLE